MKRLARIALKTFFFFDKLGLHVLPKHYYTPIPDYAWLRNNRAAWSWRASMLGVHWDLDEQLEWVSHVCQPYYTEVAGLGFYEQAIKSDLGPGFGPIESQVLHCFIRMNAPRLIIEIGSGVSTACMLNASQLNCRDGRSQSRIICVEPYPRKAFRDLKEIQHLEQSCQTVASSVFEQLGPGDLLFIDSSHSVKVGSDVIRIYLDILLKLPRGVFVHIHDIFLPYLHQRSVLFNCFGWQETALLLALLTNNEKISILCCLSGLHYDRREAMAAILRDYRPRGGTNGLDESFTPRDHFPASLWLRT
jgi:hypothetical protein